MLCICCSQPKAFLPLFLPTWPAEPFCFAKMCKEGTLLPALEHTAASLSSTEMNPHLFHLSHPRLAEKES